MKKLLILFMALFVISSLVNAGAIGRWMYWKDESYRYASECDSLQTEATKWRVKYIGAVDWVEEFNEHLQTIKIAGHRPDSSLIFTAMVEFLKWPNMEWKDLDTMYRKETGWGRDKRRGVFGEVSVAQIDTNTLKQTLIDLGFDVVGFRAEDYNNVVSANEMAVLYIMRIKLINDGKFDHILYFNGFYTKLKKYNTSRFDKYLKEKKRGGGLR
jgi:hypothetical protein